LKREVPSFTVEIRQQRRKSISENGKTNWVDASMASLAADPESHRAAASVFKPAAPDTRTARSGRILPSINETATVSETATPDPWKEPPPREARKSDERQARPRPVARESDTQQHRQALENLFAKKPSEPKAPEPRIAEPLPDLAAVFSVKVEPPAVVAEVKKPPKPTVARTIKAPKVAAKAELSPTPKLEIVVDEPALLVETSPRARKRAIVGRYVLRDESEPGQSWKRRLLARREGRS
jgi:hypothetical protein